MIRAAGDRGASMIRDLAAAIIRDGKVPSDWEQSFIVCLYKGKVDALEKGNYRNVEVKVGIQQGSVLSPLLFIIVLEALSREFRSGIPWENLYADDLVIITESLEECVRRLLTWKEAMVD